MTDTQKALDAGTYVLATKYDDGDPFDQWCVGIYDRFENERHYVVDPNGKQFRLNGFRRCEEISEQFGDFLIKNNERISPYISSQKVICSLWESEATIRAALEAKKDEKTLWLWKNGNEIWAFDNQYPCYEPCGDPMVLGEPYATAVFKKSHPASRTDKQVKTIRALEAKAVDVEGLKSDSLEDFYPHDYEPEHYMAFDRGWDAAIDHLAANGYLHKPETPCEREQVEVRQKNLKPTIDDPDFTKKMGYSGSVTTLIGWRNLKKEAAPDIFIMLDSDEWDAPKFGIKTDVGNFNIIDGYGEWVTPVYQPTRWHPLIKRNEVIVSKALAAPDHTDLLREAVDVGTLKWRPINTVPRDGTSVLLLTPDGACEGWFKKGEWEDHPEYGAQYDGAEWVFLDDKFTLEVEETPDGYDDGCVTHWMHLPRSDQKSYEPSAPVYDEAGEVAKGKEGVSPQGFVPIPAHTELLREELSKRCVWLEKERRNGGHYEHLTARLEECQYILCKINAALEKETL